MALISADNKLALKDLLSKWDPSVLGPGVEYELEIRLGTWSQDVKFKPGMSKKDFPPANQSIFNPSISKEVYDKIFGAEFYKRGVAAKERSVTWMTNMIGGPKVRMVKILDQNNKVIATRYEVKERKGLVDLQALGLRVALALEKSVDPKNVKTSQFNFIRFRDRVSRTTLDGNWRYDFTSVVAREFGNIAEAGRILKEIVSAKEIEYDKYEIELEWVGKESNPFKEPDVVLQSIIEQVNNVALLINVDVVYTLQKDKIYAEIYNLISEKNFALKSRAPESLDFTRDLISKPVTLQLSDLGKLEVNKYSVTEKADGERHLLYSDANGGLWLINNLNEVIAVKAKTTRNKKNWLIDGEYIEDLHLFAAFDCLIAGKDITSRDLNARLEALKGIVKEFKEPERQEKDLLRVTMKKFHFGQVYEQASKVLDAKFPYDIDGLIFTPVEAPYRNRITFKWKWPEMTTTDFLIRRNRVFVENKKRVVEFHLYVAITRGLFKSLGLSLAPDYGTLFPNVETDANYFPVLFGPEELPDACIAMWSQKTVDKHDIQDNTIVELAMNPDADGPRKRWKFVRTREDKTAEYRKYNSNYGNAWKTAVSNLHAVLKPVTEEIIRGTIKAPFFTAEDKRSNIIPMRKFHNYIKSQVYARYTKNAKWLLEVAAGRFADLNRWIKNNIKNVVAFDLDKDALEEGLARWKGVQERTPKGQQLPQVYSGVGDATMDWSLVLGKIKGVEIKDHQFDVISMQFALHFMLESEEMFKQFVQNVRRYLKPGGIFMASAIDGESMMNLLKANKIENGETLDLKKKVSSDKLETIISIKQQCFCETLANTGQEVSVFVESIGGYTKEYMVNFQYVIRTFQQAGFELVELLPFEDMYQEFRRERRGMPLSDVEKIYSFLGRFLIMKG